MNTSTAEGMFVDTRLSIARPPSCSHRRRSYQGCLVGGSSAQRQPFQWPARHAKAARERRVLDDRDRSRPVGMNEDQPLAPDPPLVDPASAQHPLADTCININKRI